MSTNAERRSIILKEIYGLKSSGRNPYDSGKAYGYSIRKSRMGYRFSLYVRSFL